MAEKFISYERHGVVEVSTLVATHGGAHINNFVADVDVDNGSVVKMGDFVETDYYKAEVPAVTDAVFLIATEPKIYSEYTKKMQEESNFYNGAGEIMQGDDMVRHDRFVLSVEAMNDDAAPAVGEYVGVDGNGYKLTTLGTNAPTGRGFVGLIEEEIVKGNGEKRYRVHVLRNMEVEAALDKS